MTRVPESNEPPAISLRGVAKRYGADRALEPTDLDVRDGEFFCLLGPSGCGKTTTLNLIGGFVEPTQGEIWIRGERVDRVPPHRRNVNTVFQSYALFPHMTVRDNVGFGLKMARVAKPAAVERVARALRLVGLEEFEGRYPGQLSGGQQQRVAVARALVYVTHDQEEAMTMGDRIAVMNAGQVVQVGAPREVYERPRSRFVADFIGESNFLPIRVEDARTGALVLADGRPLPPATVPENARSGSLMVRPEAIRLDADEPSGRALPATVDASSFVGSYTRVVVVCEGVDAPVTAALHGTDRSSEHELRPGTRVWVSWPREEAVVLEEEIPEQEENEQ
jgi:spermidine/putrescine transport system ATP-binding protein